MDLTYTPEDIAFRKQVRSWLEHNVPSPPITTLEQRRQWHRRSELWNRNFGLLQSRQTGRFFARQIRGQRLAFLQQGSGLRCDATRQACRNCAQQSHAHPAPSLTHIASPISFPSSAWERNLAKLRFARDARRSRASRMCVPKRSLGTRKGL